MIEMENKSSQYYVCLDRPDYTLYLSEEEVLLQAGLIAKVKSIEELDDENGTVTIFNLQISESMIRRENLKRMMVWLIPLIFICIKQFVTVIPQTFY